MKVFTYDMKQGRFISSFLPTGATNVISYNSDNVIDVSAVYSNAIESNGVAKLVILFWENPSRMDKMMIKIDEYK